MSDESPRFDDREIFLPLIPLESESGAQQILKDLRACATAARRESEFTRSSIQRAQDVERRGGGEEAARERRQAAINHRCAAERLSALAGACRRLMRWAALDWRPTRDVAGSGLTEAELRRLCDVMGTSPKGAI